VKWHEPVLFPFHSSFEIFLELEAIALWFDLSIDHTVICKKSDTAMFDVLAAMKWEQDWLMSFHPGKCNIMNITTKRNPIHFYYNMHGHILESVQHAKYLGVTISTDLKWNTHIQQAAAKATNHYGCLTSQTHCWCYDVCCMYNWLPVAVPFLASWCFRLCEDPKQCSSILIWVLLGFDN
jgi:hypothetical protein